MYPGANLTVFLEGMNSTEGVIIESYGADVMIDTPPIYACNVSKALMMLESSWKTCLAMHSNGCRTKEMHAITDSSCLLSDIRRASNCSLLRCAALRRAAVCCAVLPCIVLCCAVLCCTVLCCAVLCCAVLCCLMPCCPVLSCAVRHVLCRAVLCFAKP